MKYTAIIGKFYQSDYDFDDDVLWEGDVIEPIIEDREETWWGFVSQTKASPKADSVLLNALCNRPDDQERQSAFLEAFLHAIIHENEENIIRKDFLITALARNDDEGLISALCKVQARELGIRAMILPDEHAKYYGFATPATLVVRWCNEKVVRTKCMIDAQTNKVYGYNSRVFQTYQGHSKIDYVAVEVQPYYSKKKGIRRCISEETRKRTQDYAAFWYSTNSKKEQRPSGCFDKLDGQIDSWEENLPF